MFDAIATLLAWYYTLWPSYGVAIILLTLTIMIILMPLTLKGTRSMMMMQALQPQIKQLQARYRDDREALNQEMLALYRENNINPVGGCLPLIIQFPVFIVLYRVLHSLTRIPSGQTTFDPGYLQHTTELYKALDKSSSMYSWGLDLSETAIEAMQRSFVSALPIMVLILGVAATGFYQQRQIQGRNPNATAINPQQQMIMKVLPLMLPFFCIGLPTALVVYFFISNLFRVAQQAFISHKIYKPAVASGLFESKAKDDDAPDAKGSGKPSLDKKPSKPSSDHRASRQTGKPSGQSNQARRTGGAGRAGASGGRQGSPPPRSRPPSREAAPLDESKSKSGPAETGEKGSLFGRLLGGDAGKSRPDTGARDRNGSSSTRPAPRSSPPSGGRITPPGSPSSARSQKKKKRK